MIKHFWTLICKSSSIDKETNSISLFDVIEEINVVGPPFPDNLKKTEDLLLPLNFEVVTLWAREDKKTPIKGQAIIETRTPSGKNFKSKPIVIDLSQFLRTRTRIKFNGLPFKKSGMYVFSIKIKNEKTDQFEEIANIQLPLNFKIEDKTSAVKIN